MKLSNGLTLNPSPKERDFVFRRFYFSKVAAIIFFISSYASIASAQSIEQLYKSANQYYKSNQFDKAIEEYEKIIFKGYKNAEVYYNLGNCYYKLNTVGKSVLAFERALKLSSKDEDIQHNLILAKSKCVDNIQPIQQLAIINCWNDFISFNTSNSWGIYSMIAIWISILVFVISFFIGRNRLTIILTFLFLVLSFVCLALAIRQKNVEQDSKDAVLMVTSVNVKSAPDADSNDLFLLHEGSKIHLLDKVGDWNKIRLDDGKVGWIEKGNFERI
ncbi:hypothetical protein LBMAG27_04730 [Bacteroidota bacterium]|nr:hypothetical protein LBMAG27_04730 [Bacteroidota bacterium]